MITKCEWPSFQHDVDKISQKLRHVDWDLIVGVARGGLPLAVALSHSLHCKSFGVVAAGKTNSEKAFDLGYTMEIIGQPIFPEVDNCKNVLVVDDIVAVGDGFSMVQCMINEKYGRNLNIQFASLYADIENIQQGPFGDILNRLYSPNHINNQMIWVQFPWEEGDETIA
ncbi:hypoxanthine phosphoribosyltransferase [Fontibacillus solani]|uniref:Hypoxanthine phosphoribosyltransferase n=1 Tax=Fontibacillus solani TaxID=1572857 RepID=A0A7W3XT35_9BACL|nr:phosphoribosyltransferase family protein [Fontibacillus solani]MBA9087201.1 hypoxanthine phosphoribosyltransferase [Fontibacillus solani]